MNEKPKSAKKGMGAAAAKAVAGTPETQIARLMVRAMWVQEFTAANPGASIDERKAAWKAGRDAAMKKGLASCRKALVYMKRAGAVIQLQADASKDEA